ncbi:glycine cleavage system protein H [Anopheles sinensis]|uniref:Glycine cleavage system protein H n=1 Tax=Anopheles sinensis TaxID=74873 RepID=A0A084W9G9_ANOSI|nr:glycine cleavage system protein H [Anopheles sinensis]
MANIPSNERYAHTHTWPTVSGSMRSMLAVSQKPKTARSHATELKVSSVGFVPDPAAFACCSKFGEGAVCGDGGVGGGEADWIHYRPPPTPFAQETLEYPNGNGEKKDQVRPPEGF